MSPNSITIIKLDNGNVLIESTDVGVKDYTLGPHYGVKAAPNNINAEIYRDRVTEKCFSYIAVEKVQRKDGTIVFINDLDTLVDELFTYFFFPIDDELVDRVEDLENAFRQISYKEIIDISSTTAGTITYPSGWTLDQTVIPSNAVITTIDSQDRPEYTSPVDASENVIGVTLDALGNWTVTGLSNQDVAILFEIEGVQKDVINLDQDKVIDIRGNSGDITDFTSFTLAQLNDKIKDANVDDENDPRTPLAHATTHEKDGSDEIAGDNIRVDYTPSNYSVSDNDLGSHLEGINDALVGIVASTGIKYNLKAGDNISVAAWFQYAIECDFIIDNGATMTVDENAKLIIEDGNLVLDGSLVLDGELKFK